MAEEILKNQSDPKQPTGARQDRPNDNKGAANTTDAEQDGAERGAAKRDDPEQGDPKDATALERDDAADTQPSRTKRDTL